MKVFLLVLFGFLSGIVGGMGMGGGTVLVPLLSFWDISQKTVQALNLVSFLPMCSVALVFHAKNNLLRTRHLGWVVVPASVCAIVGAFFAGTSQDKTLRKCFALFLVAVGIWQLVVAIKFALRARRKKMVVFSTVRCLKARPPQLKQG